MLWEYRYCIKKMKTPWESFLQHLQQTVAPSFSHDPFLLLISDKHMNRVHNWLLDRKWWVKSLRILFPNTKLSNSTSPTRPVPLNVGKEASKRTVRPSDTVTVKPSEGSSCSPKLSSHLTLLRLQVKWNCGRWIGVWGRCFAAGFPAVAQSIMWKKQSILVLLDSRVNLVRLNDRMFL